MPHLLQHRPFHASVLEQHKLEWKNKAEVDYGASMSFVSLTFR